MTPQKSSSGSGDAVRIDEQYLEDLKGRLEEARRDARERHRRVSGLEAAQLYSEAMHRFLAYHVERTAERLGMEDLKGSMALVAAGGFGRRELVYYSDLDFAFITERDPNEREQQFIKAFLYPLWSLKLDLGYGVHSIRDALAVLGNDLNKTTALLEARHLWGEEALSEELLERLHSRLRKQHQLWFVQSLVADMKARHQRNGDTVFLLEPDIKNSRGGLRDIHLILWITFSLYGEIKLDVLVENGLINDSEKSRLLSAWSFLLDMRNSLHLSENRRVDKLTIERQINVAKMMGLTITDAALAEESLMRFHYEHAAIVDRLGRRLLEATLRGTPGTEESQREMALPRRVDRDFWARGGRLWIDPRDIGDVERDPHWALRLFHAAAREGLEVADETLRLVEERLGGIDDTLRKSRLARDLFLGILGAPGKAAQTLRAMNRCGLLSKYIPEFATVRNLPRIDHYHQYTVDEHLIRSVEVAERLQRDEPFLPGMEHVAGVAREILRLDLLHLALLLHDVGKGEGRAHVIRGLHIAQRVSERMALRPIEQEIVRSLVANHQKMSHMALRRDIEDPGIPRELAEAVVRPELLRMLYVHSVCDLTAVSVESWNDWRGRLIAVLYDRTMDVLRGVHRETAPRAPRQQFVEKVWDELQKSEEGSKLDRSDLEHFFSDMPGRYTASVSASEAVRHLVLSRQLSDDRRIVYRTDTYEGSNYVEITFVARDAPGLFSNLCGSMAAKRFNILSAQIYTATSGEAVDIFQVQVPPAFRDDLEGVMRRITDQIGRIMLKGERPDWTKLIDRKTVAPITADRLHMRPPRVDISNTMAPTHTVIEVRAPDRPGLLSDITAVFDRMGVNVDLAFIATESYQVVDVFYVTDLEINKLGDGKLAEVREALNATIQAGILVAES